MAQNQQIMCTINNCHYWAQGNRCDANQILVTSDQFGAEQPDSMDAPQAATMSQTPVNDCMGSACKTFALKGSGDNNVDGVMKI